MDKKINNESNNKEKAASLSDKNEFDESVFDHTGHRQRLKDFYIKNGIDVLKDYEILEMILFYAIPRKDTRVIARRLLNKFGALSSVMDAEIAELAKVKGMSHNTAVLLKLIPDAARAYLVDKKEEKPYLDTEEKIHNYLSDFFVGRNVECFYLLCLDNAGRLIKCLKMAEGEPDNVHVNVKKVGLEIASVGASSVVIAHNHPKGLALPSRADVEVTEKIAALAEELGSRLFDHIIYSPTESFSMANSRKFYGYFFRGK